MKSPVPLLPPLDTTKSVLPLKTMPVGFAGPDATAGMVTISDCGTPLPSYRVEVCVPLFATQTTPFGLNTMPQPFFRLGSTWAAATAPSETRIVLLKCVSIEELFELPPQAARKAVIPSVTMPSNSPCRFMMSSPACSARYFAGWVSWFVVLMSWLNESISRLIPSGYEFFLCCDASRVFHEGRCLRAATARLRPSLPYDLAWISCLFWLAFGRSGFIREGVLQA